MPGGYILKLAALLATLGLVSTGIYWWVDRPPTQAPGRAGFPAVDPEVRRLVDQLRTGVNPQAGAVLSNMGSRAVPALIQALDLEPMDTLGERVRRVLVGIGPAAIAPLTFSLRKDDLGVPVRIFIVGVLGNIGDLQAIPALIGVLDDPSRKLQLQAIETLTGLGPEAVPILVNRLIGPAYDLSPQARKNLVRVIGQHAGVEAEPALRQVQALEKDPEVSQALAGALNRISEGKQNAKGIPPKTEEKAGPAPSGGSHAAAGTPGRPAEGTGSAPAPPVRVQVQVSAEARASVDGAPEKEKGRETAQAHADRAEEHLKRGEKEKALAEYRQAYLLNPQPVYFLIILYLEGVLADSSRADTASVSEDEPPPVPVMPVPVTLEEIYGAMSAPHPNLNQYGDAPGIWKGRLARIIPLGRDAQREQFLVLGTPEGRDFVASLPEGNRRARNLQAGDLHVWKGKLQGFKVTHQQENARLLPVLLVDEVE